MASNIEYKKSKKNKTNKKFIKLTEDFYMLRMIQKKSQNVHYYLNKITQRNAFIYCTQFLLALFLPDFLYLRSQVIK